VGSATHCGGGSADEIAAAGACDAWDGWVFAAVRSALLSCDLLGDGGLLPVVFADNAVDQGLDVCERAEGVRLLVGQPPLVDCPATCHRAAGLPAGEHADRLPSVADSEPLVLELLPGVTFSICDIALEVAEIPLSLGKNALRFC